MPSIIVEEALGDLFFDLHAAGIFQDGKELSDAVFRMPPDDLRRLYQEQKNTPGFDLERFYDTCFEKAPELDSNYQSDTSLPVEEHIERLWPVLSREPASDEKTYSSKIPLPYSYVVPGGRFNEIYYWDSYFTMLGLKESGRIEMIENMVNNFSWLIDQYGFIPNGNRTYFRGRSQPPFFSLMVELLADCKGPEVFVRYFPQLQKEYAFWMNGVKAGAAVQHTVSLETGVLNRYFDTIPDPRTEMYSDDVELLERNGTGGKKLLLDIRAACESGWDFSSRWCLVPEDLTTIHTTDILPVDLNCLLYKLETILMKAAQLKGDPSTAIYAEKAAHREQLILDYFWDPEAAFFKDYDFQRKQRTASFHLGAVFPLYFGIADEGQAAAVAERLESDFLKAGGLITTTFESGQQWDAPNAWAPLQWIAICGLRNYGFLELANEVKARWVALNKRVYRKTGKLLEKYNVVDMDLETGGGEYPVQDGFGWTNGVLLRLLKEP